MGVGNITEAREVTRGTVSDGGSSVRVGGGAVPNLARGVEDALGDRLKKVESLGIVGNAWMARRERAVDEAERLIRDHELESRTVGYVDEHGVRRPGIETLSGEQAAGAADAWQRHNLRFAEKVRIQEGIELDQRQWDELRRRLHNDMTRTYANLSKWSATQVAGAEMVKVGADYTDSLKRRNGELMSVGRNDAVVGAEKALGADDADIAKMREDLEADDVEHYVSSVLQDRDDFVVRSVQRGYGLKSEAAAKAEADKVMRESAEAAVLSLAQAGRYDRARKLVEQGKRLGYDDAALAKGREIVDGFEMNAATANGLKAYGTVWNGNGELIRGRDKVLDAQIATLKRIAENAPKGSRTAIAALQQAERFEDAADSIAYGYVLDDISSGRVEVKDYGKRKDGTKKGTGWLGELQTSDGKVATEYSVGVNIDGKEVEIPTLVPTLTKSEVKTMLDDVIPNKKKVPDEIVRKAALHAKKMIKAGKSPFANDGYSPYQPGTRAARLWPKAVEAWERKETEEYRKNRSLVLGQSGRNAEEFIANDNPQGYLAWLDEQLDKGTISLSDRKAEKDKFMSVWARSPQMKERAKAMLRIVKEELGADFGSAIKGGQDNPEFDKDGSLIVKKGAELPEVTYGRRVIKSSGPYPFQRESWDTERFSGEDFKYIMDHSLQFAVADGLKVPVGSIPENLQWMVSDDDRKNGYRTVNCVNDFGAFVRRLALGKRVKAIKNRKSTEYMRLEGELKTLGTSPEEYMGITNTGYLRRQMH